LTASTSDVLEVLPINPDPQAATAGKVAAGGKKFYQVYLQAAKNLSFILEPCVGEVDLYESSKYNRPDGESHDHWEWRSILHNALDQFTYAANDPDAVVQTLFFGVVQASAIPIDSQFNIKVAYLDSYPETSPIVADPELTTTNLPAGTIEFQFTPAKSAIGTRDDQLIYNVYWTDRDDVSAILYTQCGVDASRSKTGNTMAGFNVPLGQTTFVTRITGLQDATYKFNVLVTDPNSKTGPTPYTVNSAHPTGGSDSGDGGSKSTKIFLGVGIPVGIIVVALLIYLWVKNRKLSKELSIEMHE
jgi:hypothetical protein